MNLQLKLIELKGELAELSHRSENEPDNKKYIEWRIINVKTQIREIEEMQLVT